MKTFRLAGITLIAVSLGFIAVFSYLAAYFGYPEVLQGTAASVLPALVAGGPRLRAVWGIYAVLPAGVAVAAILAFPMFRRAGERMARFGLFGALTAAGAMIIGLVRWPTLNYVLGQRFIVAGAGERQRIAAIFDAGNLYLGTVTGEFIGELALSLWFFTLSLAILRGVGAWRWTGYAGLAMAASMTVGALRNLTSWVHPVAALNNSLLGIWLIALGAALIATSAAERRSSALARLQHVGRHLSGERRVT
jgi:hypothetical protein